jgi:hypothetical protein
METSRSGVKADAELIAEFIERKGVTACPPGEAQGLRQRLRSCGPLPTGLRTREPVAPIVARARPLDREAGIKRKLDQEVAAWREEKMRGWRIDHSAWLRERAERLFKRAA